MKEFWDERFSKDGFLYGKKPNPWFKNFIDNNKPGKILLPGEGEGRNSVYAAEQEWQVYAVDQSIIGQQKAMMLAKEKLVNINYKVGDITKLNYSQNSFDVIALVFLHLPNQIRNNIHSHLVTLLKPRGKLWIFGFSTEQLQYDSGGPKDKSMLYTNDLLRDDFSELEITLNKKFIGHLQEGSGHTGEASLIEFEAIKKDGSTK